MVGGTAGRKIRRHRKGATGPKPGRMAAKPKPGRKCAAGPKPGRSDAAPQGAEPHDDAARHGAWPQEGLGSGAKGR